MKLRLNILLLFFFAQRTSSSFEASSALTKKLQNFINDRLGVQRMQDHLDASQFTTTPVESSNLLKTLSESLSVKFTERVEVVQKLRDEVEKRWASLSSSSHAAVSKCCSDLDIHEIDSNFQQIVDRTEACHHGQGLAMNPSKFVDNIIINVMKENLYQYPSIKFQYVGTEEGVTTVFPKFKTCSSTYDPRFRPWYVEAATPEPKDVVVVIDISGSMKNLYQKRTLLDIAKEAADTVITTLNPNDRVGIISFSDNANSATEDTNKINCKSTELAIATPHNKAYLKSYISSLNAHGGTIYSSALSLAFDFFSDSTANDQVILFLTDGKPGEDNQGILQTISQKNEKLGNKVAILTYGLGGLITSVCLPFYYKSNLKGVTCVDISMSDLLSDVAFFGRTDSSYAFIMDSVGRLLMHPLLPSPQSITDDPIFLQATSLETFPEAKDVVASMLRGKSGSEAFPSLRVLSRGDSIVEGSLSTMFDSIYSWTQLTPHGFALCIVTVVDDIETLPSISANPYENFRYHRLDLDPNSEMCQYFGAAATIGNGRTTSLSQFKLCLSSAGSTVHLSPAAFDKPYLQLIREETTLDVERYKSYFVGNRVSSSMFKGFVYDYVVLSAYFDDLLRQADDYEELLDSFIWAYVGFNVGVFRLYPGSRLVQDYEPVQRRWYKRALAQKGNIAFSTPYEDNFGAGAVITMSKTLYAGR
ncbi:hypothetical protein CAPTEDRAFT_196424 [Capitella teleta]|uniref:VWFA domain-containing protein n=1 Tax=Capitella teleta TaxID=283909 RepID=R7T9U5_CAPTE|nr:hypothetical protein CAPTEDRAFT_196424 [Capitella teleta]|eukprot:ELT90479.1 hypothetical protein CAPTEDRAFT_196424 [Capitella teleta]